MGVTGLRLTSLFLLLLVTSGCQALPTEPKDEALPIAGVSKACISEPVFGGSACVYQANIGAEQTVVLVHGLNGRALHDWQNQIPMLARHYHVLTFDLPGFGDSDKEVAYYSPSEYARFIEYLVERYASERVILVGHSMGGAISLRYSANYPQRVDRLILADVAGVLHRVAYARQLARGWVSINATNDSRALSLVDRMANKLLNKTEPFAGPMTEFMANQLLKRELINVEPSVISALTLVTEDLSDALESIDMPTLLIWGKNDMVAPLRTARVLQNYFPLARLELIDGAAHVPMNDQPERFNAVFMRYLEAEELPSEVEQGEPSAYEGDAARNESCSKETGKLYQGRFDTLTLNGCQDVVIRNAEIRRLIIKRSTARIEQSQVSSDEVALEIKGSDVLITNSELRGATAILTSGSRLDLAGVKLVGENYSVRGGKSSSLVFSVSEIASPLAMRSVHEFVKVDRRHPL